MPLAISRAALGERNVAYFDLRQRIRDEHQISLDLLRIHETGSQPLSWLARTNATAGALGLWQGLGRRELPEDESYQGLPAPPPAGTDAGPPAPQQPLPAAGGEESRLEVASTFAVETGQLASARASTRPRASRPRSSSTEPGLATWCWCSR